MANTTRGYPLFVGGQAPSIPSHMQQLAEAIDADVTALEAGTKPSLTFATGWTASSVRATKNGASVVVSGTAAFTGSIPVGTHTIGSLPAGIPAPPSPVFLPLTGYIAGHALLYGTRGTVQITSTGQVIITVETTLTAAYLAVPYVA